MKVKELIAHLQTLDQEAPVYVADGYWMAASPVRELEYGQIPYSWSNKHPNGVVGYYWV